MAAKRYLEAFGSFNDIQSG